MEAQRRMQKKWWWLGLLACGGVIAALLMGVAPGYFSPIQAQENIAEGDRSTSTIRFPPPESAIVQRAHAFPRSDAETDALARAIALVGQLADGAIAEIPADLDPATRAALTEAEALLAAQRPQRRAGLTFQAADGSSMRIAPPASGTPAAAAYADLEPAAPVVARTDAGTAQVSGSVTSQAAGAAIDGEGVWSAIWREPGDSPFRIEDTIADRHAIRLHPQDPGSLRVNGGLVVPGRCYRVGTGLVIESAGKVGIDIVPLDAAPLVYDGPIPLSPVGSG